MTCLPCYSYEGEVANYQLVAPRKQTRRGLLTMRFFFIVKGKQESACPIDIPNLAKNKRAEIDGAATLPWSGFHASRHYVTAGGYVYRMVYSLIQTYESCL